MKELQTILAAARRLRERGDASAVATVVRIGGSTYRRPGARMLVGEDGQTWGTISGGCLEGEVAQQALGVIADRRPRLMEFELGEDDLVLGFGSGCNGTVHVLIEPVSESEDVLGLFDELLARRRRAVVATVVSQSSGLPVVPTDGEPEVTAGLLARHLAVDESGRAVGMEDTNIRREICSAAMSLMRIERTSDATHHWHTKTIAHNGGLLDVLLEDLRPPIRSIIFGDGHDVGAMVRLAGSMGWHVTVVGTRSIDVLRRRFPDADETVFLMHPEDVLRHISVDSRTAAIVMTHNYVRDRALMSSLITSPGGYVGMLGPAERTSRMLSELPEAAEASRGRLFGPVGLDIGTETPNEIALAAIAEIQAVMHNRRGGHLRERSEPIHAERTPATTP